MVVEILSSQSLTAIHTNTDTDKTVQKQQHMKTT